MADENVVKFPNGNKKHGPENQLYLARIGIEGGDFKMVIHACSLGCLLTAIMEAVPEDTQVKGIILLHLGADENTGGNPGAA